MQCLMTHFIDVILLVPFHILTFYYNMCQGRVRGWASIFCPEAKKILWHMYINKKSFAIKNFEKIWGSVGYFPQVTHTWVSYVLINLETSVFFPSLKKKINKKCFVAYSNIIFCATFVTAMVFLSNKGLIMRPNLQHKDVIGFWR